MSTNPNETQQTVINRPAPFIEDYTRRLLDPVFALLAVLPESEYV